jgi:ribonuclease HI
MKIYTDGGCSNNGQLDISKRLMRAVVTDESGVVLVGKNIMGGSNNIAELWAVQEALRFAQSRGIDKLELFTDSKNTLAWVAGRIGRNNKKQINDKERVLEMYRSIQNLTTEVQMTIAWVPRAENLAGVFIETEYGL